MRRVIQLFVNLNKEIIIIILKNGYNRNRLNNPLGQGRLVVSIS